MACNGSVILALKEEPRSHWNNLRTGQEYLMPPSRILFSSPLQLVFNSLLLVCGFLFFFC